jgi:hypothetical protein
MIGMNATLKRLQAPARKIWRALAAHQNQGVFTHCAYQAVPAQGDPRVRLPQGLDLRASGPGFANQPARLELSASGEALVHVAGKVIALGNLAQKHVETGWMVTGLRLRGAIRVTQSQVVLLVPDREDLPYLMRTLVPPPAVAPALSFSFSRAA